MTTIGRHQQKEATQCTDSHRQHQSSSFGGAVLRTKYYGGDAEISGFPMTLPARDLSYWVAVPITTEPAKPLIASSEDQRGFALSQEW